MVCLDAAGWIVGIDVECVEMGTDLLDGREVLGHAGACFKDTTLGCSWIAWDSAEIGTGAFSTGGHFGCRGFMACFGFFWDWFECSNVCNDSGDATWKAEGR